MTVFDVEMILVKPFQQAIDKIDGLPLVWNVHYRWGKVGVTNFREP
jgi:hypothetical protein